MIHHVMIALKGQGDRAWGFNPMTRSFCVERDEGAVFYLQVGKFYMQSEYFLDKDHLSRFR